MISVLYFKRSITSEQAFVPSAFTTEDKTLCFH